MGDLEIITSLYLFSPSVNDSSFFPPACQHLIVHSIIMGSDWQPLWKQQIWIHFCWVQDPFFLCTGTSLWSLIWSQCVRNATRSSPWSWRRGWRSCLTLLHGSKRTGGGSNFFRWQCFKIKFALVWIISLLKTRGKNAVKRIYFPCLPYFAIWNIIPDGLLCSSSWWFVSWCQVFVISLTPLTESVLQ